MELYIRAAAYGKHSQNILYMHSESTRDSFEKAWIYIKTSVLVGVGFFCLLWGLNVPTRMVKPEIRNMWGAANGHKEKKTALNIVNHL